VGDFRSARASITEAWRDFRWLEYRPFMYMMLAELLFLFLASNLTTPWGMAGGGFILRTLGEPATHYPASFLYLVSAFARVESVLFALAGSFLIPLSLARIQAPMLGVPPTGPETVRRARRAYPVTLTGYLLNVALLIAWEYLLGVGPRRWIGSALGGLKGELVIWGLGMLVAFAIAAVFLYVPIRAVEGSKFGDALWGGIKEGLRAFGPTLFLVLVFAWPTTLLLAPLQIAPSLIVARVRPELTAILLAVVAVVNSFVNYFIFAAASRMHWLMREPKGEPL
jgi:hypothetical protein